LFAFTYNSSSVKLAYKIEVPLLIQLPKELTEVPISLGDHLRRRRLELGLYQKNVASRLGVTTSTIINWEKSSRVTFRYLPGVISFLGYNPIPLPDDLMEKLAWYKQVNGLTFEQLGAQMSRDPEQLADWLSGRCYPCRRNREKIDFFLRERLPM